MTTYIPALSTNSVSSYISTVVAVPDLGVEEEKALFKAYQEENDKSAAQRIILANLKLVVRMAYKYRRFRDAIDLIQEGNVGLLTALGKFDIDKGVRFVTYAALWVKAKIQEFIISHMGIVRYGKSRDERKLFFNLMSTIKEIESYDYGRELSQDEVAEEVAARLDISPSIVRENMRVLSNSSDISIDQSYDDGEKKFLLKDDSHDYDSHLFEKELKNSVSEAIDTLNEREQYIIKERYITDDPMKLEDIGNLYGISKERVRQIEARAIEKLRAHTAGFLENSKK